MGGSHGSVCHGGYGTEAQMNWVCHALAAKYVLVVNQNGKVQLLVFANRTYENPLRSRMSSILVSLSLLHFGQTPPCAHLFD